MQELAGLDVVVEARELAVLGRDADQPAFPGAEERRDADEQERDQVRDRDAERVEIPQQVDAEDADRAADGAADDPVAHEIERLEIVARVDVLLLEAGFVA